MTLDSGACAACGEMFFPRPQTCPRCGGGLSHQQLSGKGDVYSYTVIHDCAPGGEDDSPYAIALVHLAEGPYVTARLVDVNPGMIFIGMPVEVEMAGETYVFRPRRSLIE